MTTVRDCEVCARPLPSAGRGRPRTVCRDEDSPSPGACRRERDRRRRAGTPAPALTAVPLATEDVRPAPAAKTVSIEEVAARYADRFVDAETLTAAAIERLRWRRGRGFKTCTACAQPLPVAAFGSNSSRSDGLAVTCRGCRRRSAV